VSVEEAKKMVDLWYKERQEVLLWQEKQKNKARTEGRVWTLLGRSRCFPSLDHASIAQRGHIERAAINTPVQTSAYRPIPVYCTKDLKRKKEKKEDVTVEKEGGGGSGTKKRRWWSKRKKGRRQWRGKRRRGAYPVDDGRTADYAPRGSCHNKGSAADVAMCAMLEIDRNIRLKELGWKLVLQVDIRYKF
ncbi:hypothetical protein B296_00038731, partial [Ensete ventricosum]